MQWMLCGRRAGAGSRPSASLVQGRPWREREPDPWATLPPRASAGCVGADRSVAQRPAPKGPHWLHCSAAAVLKLLIVSHEGPKFSLRSRPGE